MFIADYLGMVPYQAALELQHSLVQARANATIPDVLLLLEHPHIFTTGRFRGEEDLIISKDGLEQEGISLFHSSRGGSITYHGPGQLISYPIFDLKENRLGVRQYIWKLEETVIKLLTYLGIQGRRNALYPGGVWVDDKKVCSIGVYIRGHIAMHGLALNVSTDLSRFRYIRPCGLNAEVITSISEISGHPVAAEDMVENLIDAFSETIGLKAERGLYECLNTLDAPVG
jgi:lipoate-protein ligase B